MPGDGPLDLDNTTSPYDAHPPEYLDVQEPPPTYQQITAADRRKIDVLIAKILCAGVARFFGFALLGGLPLACIIVGMHNLDACPSRKYTPLYLVAVGVVSLVGVIARMCISTIQRTMEIRNEGQTRRTGCCQKRKWGFFCADLPVIVVLVGLNFAGAVYIYPTVNKLIPQKCDENVHQFAFWILTLQLVIGGIALLIALGVLLNGFCQKSSPS